MEIGRSVVTGERTYGVEIILVAFGSEMHRRMMERRRRPIEKPMATTLRNNQNARPGLTSVAEF
jgi:hypothetical protein